MRVAVQRDHRFLTITTPCQGYVEEGHLVRGPGRSSVLFGQPAAVRSDEELEVSGLLHEDLLMMLILHSDLS